VHFLRYAVKCTVTDSLLNTETSCSKCPPSAWISFLTCVTRELVTLRSTAVLGKVTSSVVTRVKKGIKQMEGTSNNLFQCSTANL